MIGQTIMICDPLFMGTNNSLICTWKLNADKLSRVVKDSENDERV